MRCYSRYLAISLLGLFVLSTTCIGNSEAERSAGIEVSYTGIDVVVKDSLAVVTVAFSAKNTGSADREMEFSIIIPGDSFFTNLSVNYDGVDYYGVVKEAAQAEVEYDEAVESGKSAIKLTKLSSTHFCMVMNIAQGKTANVSFRYSEFLVRELGGFHFSMVPADLLPAETDSDVSVTVDVHDSHAMITKADIAGHADPGLKYEGTASFTGSFEISPSDLNTEITVSFETADTDTAGTILFHKDGELAYFVHKFAPGTVELGGEGLDKDIVFIVDRSGSMSGDKIVQTREAFGLIMDELAAEKDRFNIISFSSDVSVWKQELQAPDRTTVEEAKEFISSITASGSTNIIDSLEKGLEIIDDGEKRMKVIVFLTDGNPTAGSITSPPAICAKVLEDNVRKVSIFSLGVGNDVDFDFLQKLSILNYARAYKIDDRGDISEQIGHFYDTISTPLIYRLNLGYDNAMDVYHRKAPYHFKGQEHCVVGKLNDTGLPLKFHGTGVTVNDTTAFSGEFPFVDESNPFAARLWAFMHIRWCEEMILVSDDDGIYEAELTQTAIEFQIVTDYTTMILVAEDAENDKEDDDDADDDDDDDDGEELPEAAEGYSYDPTYGGPQGGGYADSGGSSKYDDDVDPDGVREKGEGMAGYPEMTALIIPAFVVVLLVMTVRRKWRG